ncbi:MAG: PQQ-binding-like beta-propeller repeat protein [Gemmataceae bacterium]
MAALAFAADDSRLVIARAGRAPEELTLPELTPTGRFPAAELSDRAAALTPDGRVAVAADGAGRLVVWVGGAVRVLDFPDTRARTAAVTPDGKTAVVVPQDGELARVDLAAGRVTGRLAVSADGIRDVLVVADGSACVAFGDTVRVVPFAGGAVRTIEPMTNVPGPPLGVVAPESGRLYLAGIEPAPGRHPPGADRSDVRYELPLERRQWFFQPPTRPRATAMAVSADEAAVAVGTGGGKLVVFAAASGKVTSELTLPGGVKGVAFSTGGRVLAAALDGGRVVLVPLGK